MLFKTTAVGFIPADLEIYIPFSIKGHIDRNNIADKRLIYSEGGRSILKFMSMYK